MQKKASTYAGVMLAAMADELQHIHREKLALNPAILGNVGNMLGSLGSKAMTGVTSLAGKISPNLGAQVGGRIMQAGNALGPQNLAKVVGGGIVGAGALGAAGAARGLMGGQRR